MKGDGQSDSVTSCSFFRFASTEVVQVQNVRQLCSIKCIIFLPVYHQHQADKKVHATH